MAVKPTDCIIHIDKLVKFVEGYNCFGEKTTVLQYPVYWEKFNKHVQSKISNLPRDMYWSDWSDAEDDMFKKELAKFNATWKQTKTHGKYLKFRSKGDMLMFIMKWS